MADEGLVAAFEAFLVEKCAEDLGAIIEAGGRGARGQRAKRPRFTHIFFFSLFWANKNGTLRFKVVSVSLITTTCHLGMDYTGVHGAFLLPGE